MNKDYYYYCYHYYCYYYHYYYYCCNCDYYNYFTANLLQVPSSGNSEFHIIGRSGKRSSCQKVMSPGTRVMLP